MEPHLDLSSSTVPALPCESKNELDVNNDGNQSCEWSELDPLLKSIMSNISREIIPQELLCNNNTDSDSDLNIAIKEFDNVLNLWENGLVDMPQLARPSGFNADEILSLASELIDDASFNQFVPNTNIKSAESNVPAEESTPRTTYNQVLSAIEAPDMKTLLEQFEESEKKSGLPKVRHKLCDKPKHKRLNEIATNHKQPSQLPRFSIILKRDPLVLPPVEQQPPLKTQPQPPRSKVPQQPKPLKGPQPVTKQTPSLKAPQQPTPPKVPLKVSRQPRPLKVPQQKKPLKVPQQSKLLSVTKPQPLPVSTKQPPILKVPPLKLQRVPQQPHLLKVSQQPPLLSVTKQPQPLSVSTTQPPPLKVPQQPAALMVAQQPPPLKVPQQPAALMVAQQSPRPKLPQQSLPVPKQPLPLKVTQQPPLLPVPKQPPLLPVPKQPPNAEAILREHSYFSLSSGPVEICLSTATAVANSKQVSLLKPEFAAKTATTPTAPEFAAKTATTQTAPESLYSKLPDYYTSIVPQRISENVCAKEEVGKESAGHLPKSDVESVYNKLPSYLTMYATPKPEQIPVVAEKVLKMTKTRSRSTSNSSIQRKRTKTFVESYTISIDNKSESVPCRLSSSYTSIKCEAKSRSPSPAFKSTEINKSVQGRRQSRNKLRTPPSRNRRKASSRSPSHSGSSRSQSRSPCRSCTSSLSSSSGSSCDSRSASRSPVRRNEQRHNCKQIHLYDSRSRSGSHSRGNSAQDVERRKSDEQKKQIEDRRVVHVGNIKSGTTKVDLRKRFQIFGSIEDITLHYRERNRDCFGFITFTFTRDAFKALEHGNDDPAWPKYELSLGGRRLFCLENYADLDSLNNKRRPIPLTQIRKEDPFDFDNLLKAAKDTIRSKQS